MKKRFLSALLAVAMCAAMTPTAFAADPGTVINEDITIELTENTALSEPVTVTGGAEVTLDLNGCTLSGDESVSPTLITVLDGSLTVENGTVSNAAEVFRVGAKDGSTSGALTIEDDAVVSSSNDACVVVYHGTLNTAGSLASDGEYATITTSGGSKGTTEINVTGGSVEHESTHAIYHAGTGELNISGDAEITGVTGVEMRDGTLNISGTPVITATGTFSAPAGNGNGSTVNGAAVAVSQHTTNKDIAVAISGGTFVGEKALYEVDLEDESSENISLSVTGGSFDGAVSSENVTDFISGGTYAENPIAYVADGYSVAYADGVYTVGEKAAVDVETTVSAGTPAGSVSSTITNDTARSAATEVVNSIATATDNQETASDLVLAADTSVTVTGEDVANSDLTVGENDTVTVTVEPYLEIEVTGVAVSNSDDAGDTSGTVTSVTLDIEAKYDVTATNGTTQETETLATGETLEVTTPITITVPLPSGFNVETGKGKMSIIHTKGDGTQYIYSGDVTEVNGQKYVTFTNPNGFSEFVLLSGDVVATDGTNYYSTLAEAVSSAADGATIKLLDDVTLDSVLSITKDATITADSAVTISANDATDAFTVNGGTLILGENIIVASNTSVLYATAGGEIVIDGAVLNVANGNYSAAYVDNGKIEVKDGSINQTGNNKVTLVAEGASASVVVNGGSVTSDGSSALAVIGGGSATISGGEVKTTASGMFAAAYATGGGSIEVTGGAVTVDNENNDSCALVAGKYQDSSGGEVIVNGGTVEGVLAHEDSASTATITNGNIVGNVGTDNGATMTVSGGSFTVDPSAYAAADYIVKVTDNGYSVAEEKDLGRGTYTSDPSDSLASGYYAVNNGDGTWTVYKKSSDPTSRGDYKITVKNAKNGDVDVNVDYADKGDKVTITVDPDKGYVLESLTVTDKDGDEIDLTKKSDTKYTFTMPKSKVTVTAVFVAEDAAIKLPFVDVAEGDACYDAVAFVYANGLMVGVGDGTKFAPEMTLSRAMTAQIFHNLEKNPAAAASTFTDVARNFWYTDAIDWATAQGVISGDGKGNFMPSTDVTREQLAVMLYQYAQSKGYNVAVGSALTQPDAANVSFWATDAMTWAVNNGILVENGVGYLAATDVATRADVAEAFMAFVNLYA